MITQLFELNYYIDKGNSGLEKVGVVLVLKINLKTLSNVRKLLVKVKLHWLSDGLRL